MHVLQKHAARCYAASGGLVGAHLADRQQLISTRNSNSRHPTYMGHQNNAPNVGLPPTQGDTC
jgi:hypothetical protein